ncbi:hypothetical protein [Kibdelosporangium philippinense]|uniref:hypothetical protein n=1 Tax=Kibdelosporangium philippinense TaxID=211113 RepID=UPI003617D0C3
MVLERQLDQAGKLGDRLSFYVKALHVDPARVPSIHQGDRPAAVGGQLRYPVRSR